MNRSYARPILVAGALSLLGMPWGGSDHKISTVHAAPWIAPAPQQELSAKWVQGVAREFRKPKFRNIFMNIPGGSPQSTILDLLNEAAVGLENGEPGYARHLVRKAVNVLDRGAGRGWYTESDIQPIQAMILKYAKQGFSEADQNWKFGNGNNLRNREMSSNRSQDDGVSSFNPDEPNFSGNRWDGYTSHHWQGNGNSYGRVQKRNIRQNTENFERSRNRTTKGSFRDRENNVRNQGENRRMERGGTQRYYSDNFYYSDDPWKDRGRRSESSRGRVIPTETRCLGQWNRIDVSMPVERKSFIANSLWTADNNGHMTVVPARMNILNRPPKPIPEDSIANL